MSEAQCILARTRPTQTRTRKASINKSSTTQANLDLMYLGKTMAVRKKIVATTMV